MILKIREPQTNDFASISQGYFVRDLLCILKEIYPDYFSESIGNEIRIGRIINKAAEFQIRNQGDVADLVDLDYRLGHEAFTKNQTLAGFIGDQDLDAIEKMNLIRSFFSGPDNVTTCDISGSDYSRSAHIQQRLRHIKNPSIRISFIDELDCCRKYANEAVEYEHLKTQLADFDHTSRNLSQGVPKVNRDNIVERGLELKRVMAHTARQLRMAAHNNRVFVLMTSCSD